MPRSEKRSKKLRVNNLRDLISPLISIYPPQRYTKVNTRVTKKSRNNPTLGGKGYSCQLKLWGLMRNCIKKFPLLLN